MNQDKIEKIAIRLANRIGLINMTQARLCFECDIPVGSFNSIMGCSFTDFVTRLHLQGSCKLGKLASRSRNHADLMKDYILQTAVVLSVKYNYKDLTRNDLADELQIAPTLINRYFGLFSNLKDEIVKYAIRNEELAIIAQAITFKDPLVKNISNKLKTNALKAAING